MTLPDTILTNMAKALNSESHNVPTHNVVATTEVTSISISATTLSGIIGTADAVVASRSQQTVNFIGTRSGTGVVDTSNGDALKSCGIFDAASSGGNTFMYINGMSWFKISDFPNGEPKIDGVYYMGGVMIYEG